MIYLDNQTLKPPSKEVRKAVHDAMERLPLSSLAPYVNYRQDLSPLYTLVGAREEDHFIYASSGAEAVSNVITSTYVDVTRKTGKHHFLTSSSAEAPMLLSMTRLQEMGCHFQTVDAITADAFAETLTPRTALISLSWADGMTGVIHPVEEIAALCKERGILFHVDATHVLGKGHFRFSELGADYLTFNGEQIGGPKGSGGLFIRAGAELSPLIFGHALNHPQLAGLLIAATQSEEMSDHLCMETARLRALFEERLLTALPGTEVFFREEKRLPSITALGFTGVTTEALSFLLMRKKLFANMGGGLFQQISHLLKGKQRHSALSFALSERTTEEEILTAAQQIVESVEALQRYSEVLHG